MENKDYLNKCEVMKGDICHSMVYYPDRFQYQTYKSELEIILNYQINYNELFAGYQIKSKRYRFVFPFLFLVTLLSLVALAYTFIAHPEDSGSMVPIIVAVLISSVVCMIVFARKDKLYIINTIAGQLKIPIDKDENMIRFIDNIFTERDKYLLLTLAENSANFGELQRKKHALFLQSCRVIDLDQLSLAVNQNIFDLRV